MKGIWDRKYMAGRSVSGRACPTDKIRKNVKPGLPKEELNAIIGSIAYLEKNYPKNNY
jgi:hypothetical protein